jgi:hypothetical protein
MGLNPMRLEKALKVMVSFNPEKIYFNPEKVNFNPKNII